MTYFCREMKWRKAIKAHRCSYCGEVILTGDVYAYQPGVCDDRWFETKMHEECWDGFEDDGDGEYMLYSNERPEKVTA